MARTTGMGELDVTRPVGPTGCRGGGQPRPRAATGRLVALGLLLGPALLAAPPARAAGLNIGAATVADVESTVVGGPTGATGPTGPGGRAVRS